MEFRQCYEWASGQWLMVWGGMTPSINRVPFRLVLVLLFLPDLSSSPVCPFTFMFSINRFTRSSARLSGIYSHFGQISRSPPSNTMSTAKFPETIEAFAINKVCGITIYWYQWNWKICCCVDWRLWSSREADFAIPESRARSFGDQSTSLTSEANFDWRVS